MRQSLKNKIREQKPKFSDEAILGPEPSKESFEPTKLNLIKAYNWYNYFYTSKEGREWLLDYMKKSGEFTKDDMEVIRNLDTDYLPLVHCADARLLTRGIVLPDVHVRTFHDNLRHIIRTHRVSDSKTETSQARRENGLIGVLDSVLDKFYDGNYKVFDPKTEEYLKDAPAREIKEALAYYKELLDEVSEGGEGYKHLSKKQHKDYVAFLQKLLTDINQKINNDKNERAKVRKPRKKKAKSAEQITKNVKYKEADKELNIVSVPPSSIVGASTVWLFNTKYRTLMMVCAADGQTLSVKGTTIIGFDEEKSCAKKVRKPSDVLSKLLSSGKAGMRQVFNGLKTKDSGITGRINKDTLLLKAFR